jgi:hypothetical protein
MAKPDRRFPSLLPHRLFAHRESLYAKADHTPGVVQARGRHERSADG